MRFLIDSNVLIFSYDKTEWQHEIPMAKRPSMADKLYTKVNDLV